VRFIQYNLLKRRWIPCLLNNRRRVMLSLEEVLLSAGEIYGVYDPSPLVTISLHRLLIAFLHSSLRGPGSIENWTELWEQGEFDAGVIASYSSEWIERFELFGPSRPFYQCPAILTGEERPVSRLAHHFASGNNPTLFDHGRDDDPVTLSFSQAARLLVTYQSFALAGGKGGKSEAFGNHPHLSEAPLVNGMTALLKGNTLFETLMINLNLYSTDKMIPFSAGNDKPCWERERYPGPVKRKCEGWLDLLTWQSRYILLIPEKDGVRWMRFVQGEEIEKKNRARDPMFFYESRKRDEPTAVTAQAGMPVWKDCGTLLDSKNHAGMESCGKPLSFELISDLCRIGALNKDKIITCGLTGISKKRAKIDSLVFDNIDFPVELFAREDLADVVQGAIERADSILRALRRAVDRHGEIIAGKKGAWLLTAGIQMEKKFYSALDRSFRCFISTLPEEKGTALRAWTEDAEKTARELFREVGAKIERGGRPRIRAGFLAAELLEELLAGNNEPEGLKA